MGTSMTPRWPSTRHPPPRIACSPVRGIVREATVLHVLPTTPDRFPNRRSGEMAATAERHQPSLRQERGMTDTLVPQARPELQPQRDGRATVRSRGERGPHPFDEPRRLRPEGDRRRMPSAGWHRGRYGRRPHLLDQHGLSPGNERRLHRARRSRRRQSQDDRSARAAPSRPSRSSSIRRTASSTGATVKACA